MNHDKGPGAKLEYSSMAKQANSVLRSYGGCTMGGREKFGSPTLFG
jgi:hypothetical protein